MAGWTQLRDEGNRRFAASRWTRNMRNHDRTAFFRIVRANLWRSLSILALVWAPFTQADELARGEQFPLDASQQNVLDHNERLQIVGLLTEPSERRGEESTSIFDLGVALGEAYRGSLHLMTEARHGRRVRLFQFFE